MFAQVVPVKRGARSLPFFDYEIPAELLAEIKVGQLVEIPLRKHNEFGLIISISEKPSKQIKGILLISKIISLKPFLSPNMVDYLVEISEMYHASLGSVVKSAMPPMQKRKLKDIEISETNKKEKNGGYLKPNFYIYKNNSEKISTIVSQLDSHGQTLILVPEASDAVFIFQALPKHIQDNSTIITSYISDKELYSRWMNVWNGKSKFIIGTRNSVFLSFDNLSKIIIDQGGHPGHKSWDAAPRINAKDAALSLAKHANAEVVFITHTPSVEEYFFLENNVYNLKTDLLPIISQNLEIINMNQEPRAGNFSQISLPLQEAIETSVDNDDNILIYCNRRGSSSFVSCRDCSNVIRCTSCNRPFTFHEKSGEMRCHHCNLMTKFNPVCVKCSGTNLFFSGAGTDGISKEIKKLFPLLAEKIIQIDKDNLDTSLITKASNKIFVGTQAIWSHLDWSKIKLIAFVDSDSPLYTPEYLSAEHLWFAFHDAAARMRADSSILLQTRHSEHPVFQTLQTPIEFYKKELAERKIFGYPPYKFLLKVMTSGSSQSEVEAKCRNFYSYFSQLTKNTPDIKISSPISLFPPIIRGRYWQEFVIKLPYRNYKQLIKVILKNLPDDWKADPNPISILNI